MKNFFYTPLKFIPYWDYKPTNAYLADSPSVFTSDNVLSLGTIFKNHLKCDDIDGSVVNGIREPIFFSFF